ncbi:MAG TPA: DUF1178 family protein [Syntrophales bacterium]|jgi:hypothetical protein|nr:DUF1178 family protein [Syntrophales bacterium]HQA83654.1 DUF1178 family protein [Syntrophales bacterium]
MIVYDLKCENGHKFEGWFHDSAAFEDQNARKLISCPVCGSCNSRVAPSSVMYIGKESGSPRDHKHPSETSLQQVYDLLKDHLDRHFEDVGDRFTEVAVKIRRGLEAERNIKGTATQGEEEYLKEEGIPFFKIPSLNLDS